MVLDLDLIKQDPFWTKKKNNKDIILPKDQKYTLYSLLLMLRKYFKKILDVISITNCLDNFIDQQAPFWKRDFFLNNEWIKSTEIKTNYNNIHRYFGWIERKIIPIYVNVIHWKVVFDRKRQNVGERKLSFMSFLLFI